MCFLEKNNWCLLAKYWVFHFFAWVFWKFFLECLRKKAPNFIKSHGLTWQCKKRRWNEYTSMWVVVVVLDKNWSTSAAVIWNPPESEVTCSVVEVITCDSWSKNWSQLMWCCASFSFSTTSSASFSVMVTNFDSLPTVTGEFEPPSSSSPLSSETWKFGRKIGISISLASNFESFLLICFDYIGLVVNEVSLAWRIN